MVFIGYWSLVRSARPCVFLCWFYHNAVEVSLTIKDHACGKYMLDTCNQHLMETDSVKALDYAQLRPLLLYNCQVYLWILTLVSLHPECS